MADAVIQLPPDGSGKNLDAVVLTIAGNTVYREKLVIVDAGSDNMLGVDGSGRLTVNAGSGFGGSNAAAGLTGSAVPTSADYLGVNIAGNLVGVTGVSLTNAKAATVAIVDGSGNQITSFGGGTQFADNATSGATPTGTLSMGWDSGASKVRALKVDASQNLNVNLAANSFGTFTVDVTDRAARLVGVVYGSQGQQLKQTATNFNLQVELATGATLYDARQIRALTSSDVVTLAAGVAVIGHVITDATSVTAATLSAETTKVIGVVRTSDGAGNLLTTNSTTPAAKFALDQNIVSILGTAPTAVGKLDIKGADGDVFVRQATAANLNATIVFSSPQHVIVDSATLGTVTVDVSDRTARLLGNVRLQDGSGTAITSTGSALDANLKTSSITLPVSIAANVGVTQQTIPWVDNITQFGSTNISTGTGASGVGIPRVTVANDSNILATQFGNWTARIVGNIGGVFDAVAAAAVPANLIYIGGNKAGNLTGLLIDTAGSLQTVLSEALPTGTNVIGSVNQGTSPWVVQDTAAEASLVTLSSQTKRADQVVDLLQQIIARLDANNLMLSEQTDNDFINSDDVLQNY
jgi:hypothetical protein